MYQKMIFLSDLSGIVSQNTNVLGLELLALREWGTGPEKLVTEQEPIL